MRLFRLAPLIAAFLLPCGPVASAPAGDDIERIEDIVEDFANSLHDLSLTILERDLAAFRAHFASDLLGTDVPIGEGALTSVVRWVNERPVVPARTGLDLDAFVDAWGDHLAGFASLEDVRLKVKECAITEGDPVRADAHIKFFWLGRGLAGNREWVKGQGVARAERRAEHEWRIDRFEITDIRAMVASTDMFSEVSRPSGTAHSVPDWGTPGNEVFISHGVAVADVNGDGWIDLFVTGNHENFLYVSQGDGTFENRASAALVDITPLATAPLFLDYDDDGDADLFLAATGTQMLFENRLVPDAELTFVEVSGAAGVDHAAEGYSAVTGDVNGDGRPDVYVCSYNKYGQLMPDSWSDARNGTPNLLFLNQGDGTFVESAAEWGCADSRWSYAAQLGDIDGDGRIDLYVANDFGQNAFYLNEGDRFRDATAAWALTDTGNGMGVSFGDFDNDGAVDIHVTNMSSTAGKRILRLVFPEAQGSPQYASVLRKIAAGNTLFRNVGGTFEDVSEEMGPFAAGWAFGGGFVDIDNDGWEDIHSPNGFISGKGLKDT